MADDIINPTEVCYRAFELIGAKQFDDAEKLLTNCMTKTESDVEIGLFHSVLGVVFRMKGEYKVAFNHYERAEKLIPNDPAIKLITARLLIDHFDEYDTAIRKAKKVLKLTENNIVMTHQAYTTMGLSYAKKGDKKKAIEMLDKSMESEFRAFVTPKNIDFNLVEVLVKKRWGVENCEKFVKLANAFSGKQQDPAWMELTQNMLNQFPKESEEE